VTAIPLLVQIDDTCRQFDRLPVQRRDEPRATLEIENGARWHLECTGRGLFRRRFEMTPPVLARQAPPPANDRATPLRILLGEDNETMRRLLGFVLRSDGHTLSEARDGGELLEMLAASLLGGPDARLDAIVAEQSLPGIEGITILAGLRARGLPTPFVLITADLEIQARARRLGALVLDQPFNTQAIRDAVTEALAASTRTSRIPSTS
jgi:CheY-like chemotaxis protein